MKNEKLISAFTVIIAATVAVSSCKKDKDDTTTPPSVKNINYPAAYVVNGTANNISVIKLLDNTVTETIELKDATYPHHIYLNPAKTKLAVAITKMDLSGGHIGHGGMITGQKVQIIDVVTGNIDKEIAVMHLPHNAAFNPSGTELWIPQADTMQGHILVYKTSDWSLQNTVNVGKRPSELTFSFDGSMAFSANTMDGTVSMIDPNTKAIMQTITVGIDPVGAWPAPNGKMYVDNETSQTISEIEVMTGTVTATINLGFKPAYASYSTHHSELWVTDVTNGNVSRFVNSSGTWIQIGIIPTGADAHAIVFTSNGEVAYVTNQGANTVSVIDVPNLNVIKTISVGTKPNGIVFKQ